MSTRANELLNSFMSGMTLYENIRHLLIADEKLLEDTIDEVEIDSMIRNRPYDVDEEDLKPIMY